MITNKLWHGWYPLSARGRVLDFTSPCTEAASLEQDLGLPTEACFRDGRKNATPASGYKALVCLQSSYHLALSDVFKLVVGRASCGKSLSKILLLKVMVGSSAIIHDLQQRCYVRADDEYEDILIYHYFSHTEEFLQLSEPMLRSCIAQAGFRGSVKTLLVEYCARYNATFMSEDPSLDGLTAFLSTLLKTLSGSERVEDARPGGNVTPRHIFLVLDALDEIPFGKQRDEVLEFIQSTRELNQPNLHLLVTSRAGAAEKDIADVLDQARIPSEADLGNHGYDGEHAAAQLTNTAPMQLQLMKYVVTAENVKTDIELVVRKELRIHRRLKTLQLQTKERVLDILVRLGQPR